MRSANERPVDVDAARLASMAALLALGTTALFLLLASARGLELGVRLTTTVIVLSFGHHVSALRPAQSAGALSSYSGTGSSMIRPSKRVSTRPLRPSPEA